MIGFQAVAPRTLKSPLDERDVQRVAAELERRQAAEMLPKQAWEVPGLLSYSWEARKPLKLVGIADVAMSSEPKPEEPCPDLKVNPMVRKYLARMPVQRSEEETRSHALKNLKFMILFDIEATQLGLSLAKLVGRAADEDESEFSGSRMRCSCGLHWAIFQVDSL